MPKRSSNSTLDAVKSKLREASRAVNEGPMIGSEESLIGSLRVSRSMLRQAAILLEQEGFLGVRRGIGGGYFSARPNERTIQTMMRAYQDTLDLG